VAEGTNLLLLCSLLSLAVDAEGVERLPEQDEILLGQGRDASHIQFGYLAYQPF
jgi:hypothetical protein